MWHNVQVHQWLMNSSLIAHGTQGRLLWSKDSKITLSLNTNLSLIEHRAFFPRVTSEAQQCLVGEEKNGDWGTCQVTQANET